MIIDTHAHLNFKVFENDLDEVMDRTLAENVWTINVGTRYETSQRAVEVAEKYEKGIYAAIGLHPIYAAADLVKTRTDSDEGSFLIKEEVFDKEKYKGLALSGSRRVVAIGEIGLDYYYKPKTTAKLEQFKQKQKEIFVKQIDLAAELGLPVILHCRMAHQNLIEILKSKIKNQNEKIKGVVHCFTGSKEEMRQYIDMGFFIGFNGIIFKLNLDEIIKEAPLNKILVETDCPYLTPPQGAGKRNEPIFVKHVIQKIAELGGVGFDEVAEKTTRNAKNLFKI